MISRRQAVIALGVSSLVSPFPVLAQQAGKVWRVGFLSLQSRPQLMDSHIYGAFPRAMQELGYIEGKNLAIEWRFADNDAGRLAGYADDLAGLRVDVIVAVANQAIGAARKTNSAIPIVMGNSADPVGGGFVKSLSRPGGNITGLANLSEDYSAKHLEILISIVPNPSLVGLLIDKSNTSHTTILRSVEATAKRQRLKTLALDARNVDEIERAFANMKKEKVQAVVIVSTPLFLDQRRHIAELAAANRLPIVCRYREYAEAGGLASYGPNLANNFVRAATFVDKIFKGAKPADLPVEQPTKFELIVNGKTAKALGLTIPQSLLITADKVIE